MKKYLLASCFALLLSSCSSVEKHNKQLTELKSEKALKKDVDFAYKKLKKMHPNLYWYISKEKLDYKFDSLKTTITKPMTSFAFYKKIAPVVNEVRQGHMMVYPVTKRWTKKETKELIKKGTGPFSQFEFQVFNDKLYVTKNKSGDKSIIAGSEVVAIDGNNTTDLLKDYKNLFTSDGFNQTYYKYKLGKGFSGFYSNEHGVKDSLLYNFKRNDSIKPVWIKRKANDTAKVAVNDTVKTEVKNPVEKIILTKAQKKALRKEEHRKKSVFGYNEETKTYNRNLRFIEADSSVAVMKINAFAIGNHYSFYKESFERIKKNDTKTLIIDLRDNPGGRLREIAELYSYLTDTTAVFSDKSEVVSKTSLLKGDYFKGGSIATKVVKGIFYPLYVGYTFFKVHKEENGKYYYATSESKPQEKKPNAFKGKVYVLINGGSFSASCILSSNLQGSKRATFVGEETGGTFNGTVAGRMPLIKLPESNLHIRVGLMLIAPHHKTATEGRGIFPDVAILPTLEDKLNNIDPEINWVMEDIKKNAPEQTASNN
ncbi:S41 family peptidase [Flavobacterium sp.]|uniref:S41 family peptidase n=1 Tax=Flavobacterium sp. TaxID=239 RepID=UPI0026396E2A|nr:S41 family peptidase [Flavobacterium sp.]MDD3005250.1 S41 family peptidase [Flavobacterium sp.]